MKILMKKEKKMLNQQRVDKTYMKYIIVFVCFLFQSIPFTIAVGVQPLFAVPISNVLFGEGNIYPFFIMFTIGIIVSAFVSPIIGKKFGKINIKWLFLIGSFVSGGSLILQGLSQFVNVSDKQTSMVLSALILYVFRVTLEIGTALFAGIGLPFLISVWFPTKGKSTAMGIAFAGGPVGSIVLWQPLTNWLLKKISSTNNGYTTILGNPLNIYFLYGSISIIIAVTLSLLFIRMPNNNIPKVQNQNQMIQFETVEQELVMMGPGVKYAFKNPHFWFLGINYGAAGFGFSAFSSQYAAYLQSGLNRQDIIVWVGIGLAIGSLIGNVIGGFIFEHYGLNSGILVCIVLSILGTIFAIIGILNPYIVILSGLMFGLSIYMYTVGFGAISHSLFGPKDFATILSLLALMFAIGFAIGQPIMSSIQSTLKSNVVFGKTINGNWLLMWIISIIFIVVGYLGMMISVTNIQRMGYKGIKEYNLNKTNFLLSFKRLTILLITYKIWKSQKDDRLSAKYYLKMLNVDKKKDNIDLKLTKNKKYYLKQLEKLGTKYVKKNEKINELIYKLNTASNINNEVLTDKINKLNNKKLNMSKNYQFNTNNVVYSYWMMNYYLKYKTYFINQEIDKSVENIKNLKIKKYNSKINTINNLIKKLNAKKEKFNTDSKNKKLISVINSIFVYETKLNKYKDLKINAEHHFDLIKQQWNNNKYHLLIVNPYFKTSQ